MQEHYLNQYKDCMPKNHIKAIDAITGCRTADAGVVVQDCSGCGRVHVTYLSCGNRHCNICQGHKTRTWMEKQLDRQLPGHHFMITFTIPEQFRAFFRSNQRVAYEAMFAASSQTLKAFAADPKFVGGDLPGFFGVLHTWAASFSITLTSTMWSPAERYPQPTAGGIHPGPTSSHRSRPCPRSFGPS